jgi:hypothetical protein
MPSVVVEAIDDVFPSAKIGSVTSYWVDHSSLLAGIADLADAVPEDLITCSGRDYADLVMAIAVIRDMAHQWQGSGATKQLPMVRGRDAPSVIRRVMAVCPDERPPAKESELLFIPDAELRDSIRIDVGGARQALANAEWKSATILAGAAIEALLHWKLGELAPAVLQSADKAPQKPLNDYVLNDYINVAEGLQLIGEKTARSARLAKDFRNLIHPGRAQRLGEKCSRSTALTGLGALESVLEALSKA